MPFTPAHAAAAFPLARLLPVLPITALIVGTQVPDLPLLLPAVTPRYELLHDWRWLVPANLPYALLLFFAFEWVKPAALALLPEPARRKLSRHAEPHWLRGGSAWLWTSVALVVGAASHLFWDEFTHEGRAGVRLFPVLGEPWLGTIPGCRLLQYTCGVLGPLLLAVFSFHWYQKQPAGPDLARRFPERTRSALLLTLLGLAPVCCFIWAYLEADSYPWGPLAFLHKLAYHVATATLGTELVLLLGLRALYAGTVRPAPDARVRVK